MNNRVFIADDDKNLLELYKTIFSKEDDELDFFADDDEDESEDDDFDLHLFPDGEDLVNEFQEYYKDEKRVPIAILDMRMQRMDGLTTAKTIREIDSDIYIIIITAYSDVSSSEIREQLKNNIFFFKKPFNEEELYSLVFSLINNWNNNLIIQDMNKNLERRVMQSINDLRQKDYIILKQSRQAAMGDMVSMIAHQWRQPLNVLALNLQDIEVAFDNDELDKKYLDDIVDDSMEHINYMSNIIDDFRNFFQPDSSKTTFKLSSVVESAVNMLKESFRNFKIEVNINIVDDVELNGYEHEYQQVILNILRNSQDAFIQNPKLDQNIEIEVKRDNSLSIIKIEDNGGGIDKDVIGRIFEPYFTTKHQSKGTGLGLYMSKIIVEQHMNGKIEADSLGDKAIFTVTV